jgi:hypothetical protein
VQRALADLRIRLAHAPAPPAAKRALELLSEARGCNKALALSELEKMLLVMADAGNVVQHKLLFSLISGRCELWYDKNARTLLARLATLGTAADS